MLYTILSIVFALAVLILLIRLLIGFASMLMTTRILNLILIVVLVGLLIWMLSMVGTF